MAEEVIAEAEVFLQKADPVLGALIASQTLIPRAHRENYFSSLCKSIVGQQVSVAAAAAIFKRLDDRTKMSPTIVASLSIDDIKAIGLSRQKASYIQDLAAHFVQNSEVYTHLEQQDDETVITELTAIKGIGVWTAQMFLMSTLARPDIFAPDDVGLQRAMMRLYGWEILPPKKQLIATAEAWKPYRTIASLHLWQSLNPTPA